MNDSEYIETQRQIMLLAGMAAGLDVRGFLERVEQAQSVGPVLDPTLYRAAADNLECVALLARAVADLQAAHHKAAAQFKNRPTIDFYENPN
jgi:hypothetical protein